MDILNLLTTLEQEPSTKPSTKKSGFDPDSYLAEKGGFDPEAYLVEKGGFDPDEYLASKGIPSQPEQSFTDKLLQNVGLPVLSGVGKVAQAVQMPITAAGAMIAAPFTEGVSYSDIPKIFTEDKYSRGISDVLKAAGVPEAEIPFLGEWGEDTWLGDMSTVDTNELLGLTADIAAGYGIGKTALKGIAKGTELLSKVAPKAGKVATVAAKPAGKTIGILYGASPKHEATWLDNEILSGRDAMRQARAATEEKLREQINRGVKTPVIMDWYSRVVSVPRNAMAELGSAMGVNTAGLWDLTAAQKIGLTIEKENTVKGVIKVLDTLHKAGLKEEKGLGILEGGLKTGVKKTDEALSSLRGTFDNIWIDWNKARLYHMSTEMSELAVNLEDKKLSEKLLNNFSKYSNNAIDYIESKDITKLKRFLVDEKTFKDTLLTGVTKTQKEEATRVIDTLLSNNEPIEYVENYVKRMKSLKGYEPIPASQKAAQSADSLAKAFIDLPDSVKARVAEVFPFARETDIGRIFNSYINEYLLYKYMRPVGKEYFSIMKQLRGMPILNQVESQNFAAAIGQATKEVLNTTPTTESASIFKDIVDRVNTLMPNMDARHAEVLNSLFSMQTRDGKSIREALKKLDITRRRGALLTPEYQHAINDNLDSIKQIILKAKKGEKNYVALAPALQDKVLKLTKGLEGIVSTGDRRIINKYLDAVLLSNGKAEYLDRLERKLFTDLPDTGNLSVRSSVAKLAEDYANRLSVVDIENGKAIGEIGDVLNDFVNTRHIQNYDAANYVESWFNDIMGGAPTGIAGDMRVNINNTLEDLGKTKKGQVVKELNKVLGVTFKDDVHADDIVDAIISDVYANLIGFRLGNVVRNLSQPFSHTYLMTGMPEMQRLYKSPVYFGRLAKRFVDKEAWKEFREMPLKSGQIVHEYLSGARAGIIDKNSGALGKMLGIKGKYINKIGMYLFDQSETLNRFNSYWLAKDFALDTLKGSEKVVQKKVDKMLNKAVFKPQEKLNLLTILREEGDEAFAREYARSMTYKTQFVYEAFDRSPALRNQFVRTMFMFSKWPLEITDRYRWYAKTLKEGGAEAIARDMAYGMALLKVGQYMGVDLMDMTPQSGLGMRNPPPWVEAWRAGTSGSGRLGGISPLRATAKVLTPLPALENTYDALLGKREGFTRLGIGEYQDLSEMPTYQKQTLPWLIARLIGKPFGIK